MRVEKKGIDLFVIIALAFFVFFSISFVKSGDFLALQGNVKQSGVNLDSGNLTVYIFDAYSGGNLVYNSSGDFNNSISAGKYDIFLGNGSQELNLQYGKKYYFEMFVNGERLNFTANTTKQVFQSSVGNISSININFTTGITIPPGQNFSTGVGGWFKGLFNWIIGANSQNYLIFNATTLDLTDNVTRWLYNQSTAANTSIVNAYGKWWYNMTAASSGTYNESYDALNSTYGKWWYNQTQAAYTLYNAAWNSTYNETYVTWAYNQTTAANISIVNAYGKWWYNQTTAGGWNISGTNLYTGNLGYNVGIGTIAPTQALEVNGSVNISGGNLYVNGSADFAGGWQNGGVTISGGKLFAQTGYFYNITSLTVNNLNVNASMIPSLGFDNQFDLGSSGLQWRYGYFGTDVLIGGSSVVKWLYNQTMAANTSIVNAYGKWWYNMSDGSYNASYVPYTGATGNVNLGIYNLTTLGRVLIGLNTSINTLPNSIFEVNGTFATLKNVYSSDYLSVLPGTFSLSVPNSFTMNVYENSSDSGSNVWGLYSGISAEANLTGVTEIIAIYGSTGTSEAGNVTNATGVKGYISGLGVITNAYSLYGGRSISGSVTNLYGLYLEDMSPINSGATNGWGIYSAGGDNYFGGNTSFIRNVTIGDRLYVSGNVGIGNGAPSMKLDVRGAGNFSSTIYIKNTTDISIWMYNQTVATNTSQFVPYSGATGNVNLGNNNLTIGSSNTFFVNPFTNQVGIGTNIVNSSFMLRVAGNVLIDGNLTVLGNLTQLSVQNLSTNGSIIPGTDDAFDIGSTDLRWRYGYFSRDVLITGESVVKWMYNQTQAAYTLYNAAWNSTYNETYVTWAYNQTTAANTSMVDAYGKWWYNQTTAANTSIVNAYGKWWYNQTQAAYTLYNAAWNSTYNETYATWAYNQTTAANTSMTGAYEKWWYNQTTAANTSMVNAYGKWWYNQTTPAMTYEYNETTIVNTSIVTNYGKWWYNQTTAGTNQFLNLSGTNANQNINFGNYNFTVNQTTFFVNANANKVGIGTTTPNALLQVAFSSDNAAVAIANNNNPYGIDIVNTGANAGQYAALTFSNPNMGGDAMYIQSVINSNNNQSMIFGSSNGEFMRFRYDAQSGVYRMGILTTAPTHTLNVVGAANITGGLGVGGIGSSLTGVSSLGAVTGLGTIGVAGYSTSTTSYGALAYAGYGVYGSVGTGSHAGYFSGNVETTGNLDVSGSGANVTIGSGKIYWDASDSKLVIKVS